MKFRSLTMVAALAVIASSAMAGEALRLATHAAPPAPQGAVHGQLGLKDMQPLASLYVPTRELSAVEKPNCNDCH